MNDYIIHSNKTVTPEGIREAYVSIHNGIITSVDAEQPLNDKTIFIYAGDDVLMPGIIDPHVHINEPGRTDWEGFNTATMAAISGGITTLVDMPLNASPVTTTLNAFKKKIAATQDQLHTDCGFWGGLVPGNVDEIEPLINVGVLGFKAFLTHSGIDEFPNVTEEDLHKAMPILAKYNVPLLVHCELTDDKSPLANGTTSYQAYLASRPKHWEDEAINLMIRLCEEYNCRVHIVHLSSANSIEPIRKAKAKSLRLTVETAQHYLYFVAEEIRDGATAFKCAPPIRERSNNSQLWQALQQGAIDFVATDHSPSTPDFKELQSGDFSKAWGGIASIQLALPALWTAARKRGFTIADISKWLSANPAKLISMDDKKGAIAVGYDADLITWNPNESFVVTEDMIHHKHKVTPYLGETLFGVVKQSFLGGEKVFDNGNFVLNKGRLVLRQQNRLAQ